MMLLPTVIAMLPMMAAGWQPVACLLSCRQHIPLERSIAARSFHELGAQSRRSRPLVALQAPKQPSNESWLPFGKLPGADALSRMLSTPQAELVVCATVGLSIVSIAAETLERPLFGTSFVSVLGRLRGATVVVFAIEYALRWWSRSLRPSYLIKPLPLIHLMSFLPSLLDLPIPNLRPNEGGSLGFLRVMRILRFNRFVRDERSFSRLATAFGARDFRVGKADLQLARVVTSISSLVVITSGSHTLIIERHLFSLTVSLSYFSLSRSFDQTLLG